MNFFLIMKIRKMKFDKYLWNYLSNFKNIQSIQFVTIFLYCLGLFILIRLSVFLYYYLRTPVNIPVNKSASNILEEKNKNGKKDKHLYVKFKKLKDKVWQTGKKIENLNNEMNSLSERLKIIEALCEETPEEEKERLSQTMSSCLDRSCLNRSNMLQSLNQSQLNQIEPNLQPQHTSNMKKSTNSLKSIDYSRSSVDMSGSIMLDI